MVIVGIAGTSGSGKSTLAAALERCLFKQGIHSRSVSLDAFYRDRSYLSPAQREWVNYDHPRALDWAEAEAFLEGACLGTQASLPVYDFASHSRVGRRSWEGSDVMILEGLWTFRRSSMRQHLDHRVYLDCSTDLQLSRRLRRDPKQRARDPKAVVRRFWEVVVPGQRRFVEPQRRWAHTILRSPVASKSVHRLAAEIRCLAM